MCDSNWKRAIMAANELAFKFMLQEYILFVVCLSLYFLLIYLLWHFEVSSGMQESRCQRKNNITFANIMVLKSPETKIWLHTNRQKNFPIKLYIKVKRKCGNKTIHKKSKVKVMYSTWFDTSFHKLKNVTRLVEKQWFMTQRRINLKFSTKIPNFNFNLKHLKLTSINSDLDCLDWNNRGSPWYCLWRLRWQRRHDLSLSDSSSTSLFSFLLISEGSSVFWSTNRRQLIWFSIWRTSFEKET